MGKPTSAVFLGTMNAMPMAYALKLKEHGWDITYFVDVPPEDTLSRPESKFPNIGYPYPDWIIERRVRSQLMAALCPELFLRDLIQAVRNADVVFLSGLYLCLAKFLRPAQKAFFLSYGSDLDSWCNRDSINGLAHVFANRIGMPLSKLVVNIAVDRMIKSLRRVDAAVVFPPGLSKAGDTVLHRELENTAVAKIYRYDISFDDLPPVRDLAPRAPGAPLKVICGTRHTFRDHPGLTEGENKGTDIIIRGLAQYIRKTGSTLEIHFFEKGLDVAEAKELCRTSGVADYVIWHEQMPFHDFIELHQDCHVALDQVGTHLFGLGMYAMYLGMPLIANCPQSLLEFWEKPTPLCHATTEDDIYDWLVFLEDDKNRREIGQRSHRYALNNFDCTRTVERIVEFAR